MMYLDADRALAKMMKGTIARQPFGMMIMYTMDVHKQEVMIQLGVTMFGAMITGAIVEIVLQKSIVNGAHGVCHFVTNRVVEE